MRGAVTGIPPMLQPVAHALLQASEEAEDVMRDFDDAQLWRRPADMASVGFHLRHLSGVLDRLFTYARGEPLTQEQLAYLGREGIEGEEKSHDLVKIFQAQVIRALDQLRATADHELLAPRGIGRKQIPTNVLGLLFHAAEHTQRHVGQLLVTVKWVSRGA